MARTNAYRREVMSHAGETEDTIIADLAGRDQLRADQTPLSRSDRLAKYNQLLRIEEQLGSQGTLPPASRSSSGTWITHTLSS